MADSKRRIAVVGHFTYFENHFPEGWRDDPDVICLDVSERDYNWLVAIHNFRPQLTLFYRPELYPRWLVERVPGLRVALLSEPLPTLKDGELEYTDETRLRLQVYGSMSWDAYHWRIFYDAGKKSSAIKLGFPIDEYRPLPIDTSHFRITCPYSERQLDVVFVGKPTPHRIARLDFLRSSKLTFLWIAHGMSGGELAALFNRAKLVLNVHADGHPAFEPRLYLAAACGAAVLTEALSSQPELFIESIWELDDVWHEAALIRIIERAMTTQYPKQFQKDLASLSTRLLVADLLSHQRLSNAQEPIDGSSLDRNAANAAITLDHFKQPG